MISQTVQVSSSFIYLLMTPVSCKVIKALELESLEIEVMLS